MIVNNNMFAKMPIKIDTEKVFLGIDQLHCIGDYKKQQKYGVALLRKKSFTSVPNSVYETKQEDAEFVISQLPKKLLDIEVPKVCVLNIQATHDKNVMLAPHIDGDRVTTINFYRQTNGERTCFYKYNAGGSIDEIDSFVAQDGDAWVLAVNTPHAVELVSGKTRRVLSISFIHTPFDRVMEALS
jgi:hypothetical protein